MNRRGRLSIGRGLLFEWGWCAESGVAGVGAAAVGEGDGGVGVESDAPLIAVEASVASSAEKDQVVYLVSVAGDYVVAVCPACGCGAAGEPAAAVAGDQGGADFSGDGLGGIAHGDGLVAVEQDRHHGRV